MADDFPSEIKKKSLSQVSYYWYLIVIQCLDREYCVEQHNVYFTVIGQVFHELWQFEIRHTNARNLRAVLIYFIPDPVFQIMKV